MRRGAAVVGLLVLLAGCGGGPSRTVQPVVDEHALRPTPLVGTTWLLVNAGGVTARPNVDATLLVQPDGRYLLRSCNNVFGTAVTNGSGATFDGGSDTWRRCRGVADRVDAAVATVLPGHVSWAIDGNRLTITNPVTGAALAFRVRDGAPPLDAAPVETVIDGAVRCRVVAGHTPAGDRLYALARTRADGPWRLLPTGPVAPGEGPLLAPQLTDTATGRACVAGFAPDRTTSVQFRDPDGSTQDVAVHHVAGVADAVYVGVVPSAGTGGRLVAADATGSELAEWATTP